MGETLTIIGVTAGAFIGTNLDNLLLLVAFYSGYQRQAKMVTAGYFSGMILIGLMSFVIAEAGELIPLDNLGLLGLIPMALGVYGLYQLFKGNQSGQTTGVVSESGGRAVLFTVLATQLSNGADSIITFSVFVTDSTDAADYLIAATFLSMVGLFALLANYSLKHQKVSDFLARFGRYITPFILILVGVFILSNTASDMMPG